MIVNKTTQKKRIFKRKSKILADFHSRRRC
jgi:hypothetical protein